MSSPRWFVGLESLTLAVIGVLALALGVLTRRADVALLGVPFLLSFAWGWITRPTAQPQVVLRRTGARARAGAVGAEVHLLPTEGVRVARLRLSSAGFRPIEALVDARPERTVAAELATARTGVQEMFRLDHLSTGFDAAVLSPVETAPPLRVTVHPPLVTLQGTPVPPRLAGLTGNHTSRRPGDGTDFRDVHLFTPGDRLRRIDWRVSARRSLDVRTGRLTELYTRRTFATADASVMLVVDSRDAVGPDVSAWGGGQAAAVDEPISLDLAREAAAAIAHVVLAAGDRVGLDDLGLRRRPVRPAAGRSQFERISRRLAALHPESFPTPRKRAPQVPSAALLVVFSTFLDDEAARMARTWRGQGHRVIAVDTLPPVRTTGLDSLGDFAYQVVRLERQVRLAQLDRAGVEVLRWIDPDAPAGARSIDVAWRLLTRAHRRRGAGVPGRPGAGVAR